MTRRDFAIASLAGAMRPAQAQTGPRLTKGICSIIFPREMPRPECFKRAKAARFDAIEMAVGYDFPLDISMDEAERMRDAARSAGISIATIWVSEPLHANPLNAADPAVRARGVEAIRTAIRIATAMDCRALLLYAVRLGNGPHFQYGSQETWDR